MRIIHLLTAVAATFSTLLSFSQTPINIDLQDRVNKKELEVINRKLTLINEASHLGIRLNKEYGEGIAWLKGIDFSNGSIEFDVRGEDIKQHSFVGIAFHGQNDSTYDAIYLRPFQFQEADEVLRKRSIQYISLPNFTWRKLRELSPGKFENNILPSPDPDSWIRMKLIVNDATVTIYINGNETPSLVVKKVTGIKTGRVGFYVADTSGGDFANVTIVKTN